MKVTVTEFRKIFRSELAKILKEYQGPQAMIGPGFEAWDHRNDADYEPEDKSLEATRDAAIKQIVKEEVDAFFKGHLDKKKVVTEEKKSDKTKKATTKTTRS